MATATTTIRVELSAEDLQGAAFKAAEAFCAPGFKPCAVHFRIEERGGDPLDRFPGAMTLVGATVECKREE